MCKCAYVELKTIHRQEDRVLVDLLQKCRRGIELSLEDQRLLLNHKSDTFNPVKLLSSTMAVANYNKIQFEKFKIPHIDYVCLDESITSPKG
jgi:hypothetical protein